VEFCNEFTVQLSHVMRKILTNKKLLALSVFGLLVIVATATFVYFKYPGRSQESAVAVLAVAENTDLGPMPKDLKTLTVLLLGYGGAGHQGGYLTDVLQLVQVDFEKSQVTLISLPRDLWVQLPNGQAAKINQAFTLGKDPNNRITSGGQVAKQMVATATGLKIDYFAAIDFVGFQRTIGENLGSIEVNVQETLDDPWYPVAGKELDACGMSPEKIAQLTAQYSGFELERQFPCRYEHLRVEPGIHRMEGGDALKFVRSRHGSSAGDFSRSSRQHAVLEGIKNKLFTLKALENAPKFFTELSSHIVTDLDVEAVQYLAPAVQNAQSFETKTVTISTDNVLTASKNVSGQAVLIPRAGFSNWSELHDFIKSELGAPQ